MTLSWSSSAEGAETFGVEEKASKLETTTAPVQTPRIFGAEMEVKRSSKLRLPTFLSRPVPLVISARFGAKT